MRFASHLGIQNNGAPKPDTRNAEGHPAHSEEWRQSIARIAFTGVLGDQYYGREQDQAKEFIPLCVVAVEKDPRFLLNAALASRKANFKLFPKIAVAAMIAHCGAKSFEKYEWDVVNILSSYSPGQLLELILVLKSKTMGKGLGSRAQRVIGNAIVEQSAKKLENMVLSAREDVRRILRMIHPKHAKPEQADILRYALGDNPVPKTPRQEAMEQLKGGFWDQAKLITDFNLPFNATKGFANADKATWTAIMKNMSTLQLLLNLRALDSRGVLTPRDLDKALGEVDVNNTRLVPHDILRPLGMVHETSRAREYREVLTNFLARLVAVPIPGLEGLRVGLSLDFSGSMAPGYSQNSLGNWILALSLAAPIMAACPDRYLSFFGNDACFEGGSLATHGRTSFPYLKGCPTEAVFHNLLGLKPNQGTNISAAINLFRDTPLDLLFLFTDEQQNHGDASSAWKMYKQKYPGARLVVINVSNTKWHLARENDPSITIIQTITPLVYLQLSNFNKSLVDMIAEWHTGKL